MEEQSNKVPEISVLLNFFWTGAGNIYNGKIKKGVVLAIIGLLLLLTSALIFPFIALVVLWIWGMFDAYKEAKEINALAKEFEKTTTNSQKFNDKCVKSYKLLKNKMISEQEFEAKIDMLIIELGGHKLLEEKEDFLYGILKLRESGILDDEKISRIKQMIDLM
jgi:TM2 domain-containing membrane protein YozV